MDSTDQISFRRPVNNDDLSLPGEYARSNSEPAFAALVERHINLVYSVAMRQMCDPHLAEEAASFIPPGR